jgi:2-oxoglutarate ferredoxin oxidoreductase subunit alpha
MDQNAKSSDSLSLAMVGSGGAGIMTAGTLLLDAASKAGWYGLMTRSVGPQIRGGEAAALLRLAADPVEGHGDVFDLLLAIDWRNYGSFAGEIPLTDQSIIISDTEAGEVPEVVLQSGARVIDAPLSTLAGEIPGGRANMVAFGYVAGLLGLSSDVLAELVNERIGAKGEKAVTASLAGYRAGMEAALDSGEEMRLREPREDRGERWLISGNKAAGLGAIRGGIRFVAGYPITPATDMLEWMAPVLLEQGGALVQAEDELASVNMIIGSSFGGLPSLTATSGPGLSLMTESIGLAVASETPIVIVDVMRGGPSTGIPTKSEQSDLNIAIYGIHGDAPHIVVAPLSIGDCLLTTQYAVHLAESLQTAAIVLSDQFLGQTDIVIDKPDEVTFPTRRKVAGEIAGENGTPYRRYEVGDSGVSEMALPGTKGGQYIAEGLTHSATGGPSTRADVHLAQLDKRARKINDFDYGAHWVEADGEGSHAIITWGSSSVAIREALTAVRASGRKVRLIALRLLSPARPEKMAELLDGVDRVLIIEQTHGAQFTHYLRGFIDLPDDLRSFSRAGPLLFRPGEIQSEIEDWYEE